MNGIKHIEVSNRYCKYKFDIHRNITIVCGESGTGKTTLYNMIADYTRDKEKSGVNISSTVPCVALTDIDWENQLSNINSSVVFIDEDSKFVSSKEFAKAIKNSDNYYVIFNRESLYELPYSVNEIYEIKTSGKLHHFVNMYKLTDKCELELTKKGNSFNPNVILTEDSNSGFQFFKAINENNGIKCESSAANSAILKWLKDNTNNRAIIICDGAAFGSEIDRVLKMVKQYNNSILILPESFEWVVLKSGIIKNMDDILTFPSSYIESSKYFSWEQFFTDILIEKTKDSYLHYNKSELNKNYLNDNEKEAILSVLPDIILKKAKK